MKVSRYFSSLTPWAVGKGCMKNSTGSHKTCLKSNFFFFFFVYALDFLNLLIFVGVKSFNTVIFKTSLLPPLARRLFANLLVVIHMHSVGSSLEFWPHVWTQITTNIYWVIHWPKAHFCTKFHPDLSVTFYIILLFLKISAISFILFIAFLFLFSRDTDERAHCAHSVLPFVKKSAWHWQSY